MSTNNNIPKRKRSGRNPRLALAVKWIGSYEGGNIIKGYSKHFGVDKLCAIKELRILGVEISEEREKQIVDAQRVLIEQRSKRKEEKEKEHKEDNYNMLFGSNEHLSFIAGFTSGGMAFGTTWEEPDNKFTEE